MTAISFDCETTGLRRLRGAKMFAFSTCTEQGVRSIYRFDSSRNSYRALKSVWGDSRFAKVAHNMKFDLGFSEDALGAQQDKAVIHCTHIMSNIMRNDHPSHKLGDLAWALGKFPRTSDRAIKEYTRDGRTYDAIPKHVMDKYQADDAERCMLLFLLWWPLLKPQLKRRFIYDVEIELLRVTMRMEERGVMIDRARSNDLLKELAEKAEALRYQLEREAWLGFNPGSADQVRRFLFKKLSLPISKRTPSGRASADKYVLMHLWGETKNDGLGRILNYRSCIKGISDITGYHEAASSEDIIHTSVKTIAAITGRQSSSSPNLMALSKEQVLLNPFPVPARRCFRPRPGFLNYLVDYSGIELRLATHKSQDAQMLQVFRDGKDPHREAALEFYGHDVDITHNRRNAAKNAHYGIIYGAALPKLAQTLGLDAQAAGPGMNRYAKRFPKLCRLAYRMSNEVRQCGFVTTEFGRRLYVNSDKAYIGVNYYIQGTAADILKIAEVRLHKYFASLGCGFHLLLPVHDEIIFEAPYAALDDMPPILRKVRELMTDFPRLTVPMGVDINVAVDTWNTKREVKI